MRDMILKYQEVIKNEEPYDVEDYISYFLKTSDENKIEYVAQLNGLLSLDWHYQHENIALILQGLKSPMSVNVLFATATKRFEYLSYDDSFALARKCTWALADIGTAKAKDKLISLSLNSNEYIAQYAKKRLDNWEKELHRKFCE